MRKIRRGWGETGRRSLYAFFWRHVRVYQLLIYPMIGQLWQLTSSPRWPTRITRVILMNSSCLVLWTSVCDLARGKDVFAIIPTSFGKSLIFQLFPRLAKAALTLENSTIIVVSPPMSIMRDQGENWKSLDFRPQLLASVKRERRTRRKRGKESPESWLITKRQ